MTHTEKQIESFSRDWPATQAYEYSINQAIINSIRKGLVKYDPIAKTISLTKLGMGSPDPIQSVPVR